MGDLFLYFFICLLLGWPKMPLLQVSLQIYQFFNGIELLYNLYLENGICDEKVVGLQG